MTTKHFQLPRRLRHKIALGGTLLIFSIPVFAAPFDLVVNFDGGLTASQESVFTTAEHYWESVITGYQTGINISGLSISASGSFIDGVFGTLGQAGPTYGSNQGGFLLATDGVMQFDSADLTFMENNGLLYNVILHEMAHVIGLGTLWTYNGTYTNGSGHYTGGNALAAYQLEFNPSATYVPVELGGGTGTVNAHWNEVDGGGSNTGILGILSGEASYQQDFKNELMTGWIGATAYVSCTTKASFIDLGYTVNSCLPSVNGIPEPGTLVLVPLGLTGLLLRFRHKHLI